jgi:hypothetical protein
MIGFSVPQNDAVLIISYQGMHLLRLGTSITVETDPAYSEYDLYDPKTGVCNYRDLNWDIIGLFPGRPLHSNPYGERLQLDTEAETVSVIQGDGTCWSITYENFSGDWAAATFSPNGQFLVLGCPYDFDFRVFEREART